MSLRNELAQATATELAEKIRQRQLSPVEVTQAAIEAIEADNDRLNALVYMAADEALGRAKEAENAVASGAKIGPLHGVPTAMKDLFDFKPGWPATFGGLPALRDYTADHHCAWAERMERAGAIIIGKTNSPVMGFRGTCDNPLFGPSRNPFDPTRNTGGSSGGSAAAVAAGLLPIAEGTDGGGSIRIPAAWCGLYGFKQSFGRVPYISRPNAFTGLHPFLFEGVLTRTVEDAALAISALSGYDPRDPFALPESVDLRASIQGKPRDWKIAFSPDFDVFPMEPGVVSAVRRAVAKLESAGAHVEEIKIGMPIDQREMSDLWCRLIIPINVAMFESFKRSGLDLLKDHRDDFPPEYLRWIDEGYRLSVAQLMRDEELRSEIYDSIQQVLNRYDVLITPTLACQPVKNATDGNTLGPSKIGEVSVDPLIGWCLTYPVNFSGHPAASIPAGMLDGLPVGMQIIGRRYADADVLALSAEFERISPWRDTYRKATAHLPTA